MKNLQRMVNRMNLPDETNLFSMYPVDFAQIPKINDLTSMPRDQELFKMIRAEREKTLSPYAFRSSESKGRRIEEPPCTLRSDFERDIGRIIYSQAFRRLRHKTQVFFNPQNDHICSRIEHVIYVNYIAKTIARALNLNLELIEAIALSHDIGHTPYGHSGEKTLDACLKKINPKLFFRHELHGLRVVDRLLERNGDDDIGLNLTFEVRDGIVCHCGETYSEYKIHPNRKKPITVLPDTILNQKERMDTTLPEQTRPATLEACVVRMADKIAYVGRDIEDAVRAGIMDFDDIPPAIISTLGSSNSQIIHTLVTDLVHHSLHQDMIQISNEIGQAMEALLQENVQRIYQSEKIKKYEARVKLTIEGLFDGFTAALTDSEKAENSGNPAFQALIKYEREHLLKNRSNEQIVVDYIAGMTDSFADKSYQDIYWV